MSDSDDDTPKYFETSTNVDVLLKQITAIIDGERSLIISKGSAGVLQDYFSRSLKDKNGYIEPEYAEAIPAQFKRIDQLVALLNVGVIPSVADRREIFTPVCEARVSEARYTQAVASQMKEILAGLTKPSPEISSGELSREDLTIIATAAGATRA